MTRRCEQFEIRTHKDLSYRKSTKKTVEVLRKFELPAVWTSISNYRGTYESSNWTQNGYDQVFAEDGNQYAVTVVEVLPNVVTKLKLRKLMDITQSKLATKIKS